MRRAFSILLGALTLSLALPAISEAQGPAYAPQPPTPGALYRDGQSGRYLLGGAWLYRPDLTDTGQSAGWWRNVASTDGWSTVSVPNSYNANDLSTASMSGWVGWYRHDFTLPSGAFASYIRAADRHWIVRFESVNYRATVWLNGRRLGTHEGAYLPFELDLKGLRRGVNRLIVRVDDRRSAGDLPPGPSGGWWNYGGILGEVYLRAVQRVDISQVQVRPLLRCVTCPAIVQEQAVLRNVTGQPQAVSLSGSYGRARLAFGSAVVPAHRSVTLQASATIRHPHLWAPDDPHLYRAGLVLTDAQHRRLGGYVTWSGVRSIKVTSGGLLELNGRQLHLRGVNLHEQAAGFGAALDVEQMQRLFGFARAVGATLIRAHYPLSPEIEELADRSGMLLWSEVPVYQVSSQYLGQPSWLVKAHALVKANILTNQNHPSVLLWSIGNELPAIPSGAEAHYISTTVALAHRLDPTRPVGQAVGSWPGVACQSAYAPLDVIGMNEYFGWFDAGGGTTDDRDQLSPYLDTFRACYPKKAVFVTEFGFEANRHGPVEERGTYEFQANSMAFHLAVFDSKPWLAGAIWFAVQDFAAHPGWGGGDPWPSPPFVQKGMFDPLGNVKPNFPLMRALYTSVTQIARAPRR